MTAWNLALRTRLNINSGNICQEHFYNETNLIILKDFYTENNTSLFIVLSRSSDAVKPARKVQKTQDSVHQSAAAGAGASVQTEQVSVATKALRGGHVAHAHRNSGIPQSGTSYLAIARYMIKANN